VDAWPPTENVGEAVGIWRRLPKTQERVAWRLCCSCGIAVAEIENAEKNRYR
jgi:hypothetical protein